MKRFALATLFCVIAAYARAAGLILLSQTGTAPTIYYVSPAGNDSNSGTSAATPWQTISHVNSQSFGPNTEVAFQGGQSFNGCLDFSVANVTSTKTQHFTVTNYGTGSATITSNCAGSNSGAVGSKSAAITIDGPSGVVINGLIIRGSGYTTPTQFGILIENENTSAYADTIIIENNDISGFTTTATGDDGSEIEVLGDSTSGYCGGLNNVQLLGNTLHGVAATSTDDNGINGYGCSDITNALYQANVVYDIGGRSSATSGGNGGNGIVANGIQTGTLQFNLVHDVGANTTTCGGPGAIWTYASNHVTIQFNEAYNVQPVPFSAGCDWNAYDIDGGVTNSVLQYNYSHNNFGAGYLTYPAGTWGQNTIRYNISENDARGGSNGAGSAINLNPAPSQYIYNNSIYLTGSIATTVSCFGFGYDFHGSYNSTSILANNLCVNSSYSTGSNETVMLVGQGSSTVASITMLNNGYYYPSGSPAPLEFAINWPSASYSTLTAFQSGTGQETNSVSTNPVLSNGGSGGTCLTSAAAPQPCPGGYELTHGSPAIGTGLNLALSPYSLSVGSQDYYGDPMSNLSGSGYNIGADAVAR